MPTKGYRETQDEKEHMGEASNLVLETREEFSKSTKTWFKFRVLVSEHLGSKSC